MKQASVPESWFQHKRAGEVRGEFSTSHLLPGIAEFIRRCPRHSVLVPFQEKQQDKKKKKKPDFICVCLDSDMTSHGWKLQSNPFLHFMDGWMVPFTQKSDVEQKSEKRWRKITKSILIQGKKQDGKMTARASVTAPISSKA